MKKLTYILIFSLLLSSCLGSKKTVESKSTTAKTETKETKKDSVSNTTKNSEIKDRIVINVPETDNVEVRAMLNSVMQRLNTQKSSGSNSYQVRYDEETKQLIADFTVAATKLSETKVTSDTKSEKTFEETVKENSKKIVRMIPWWVWGIVGIVFLPQIISRILLIINPIRTIIKK